MARIFIVGVVIVLAVGLRFLLFDFFMVFAEAGHDEHQATRIVLEPGYVYQELKGLTIVMVHFSSIFVPLVVGAMVYAWVGFRPRSGEDAGREIGLNG